MSRNRLAVSKLEEFAKFCASRSWIREETKGVFEVLRMRKDSEKDRLLVYTRDKTEAGGEVQHLTLYGHAERMFNKYIKGRSNETS